MIIARLARWDGVAVHVDECGAPMAWPPAGAIHVGAEGGTVYALMPGEEALIPVPAVLNAAPAMAEADRELAALAQALSGPEALFELVGRIVEDCNARLVAAGLEPIPAISERIPMEDSHA